MAEKDAGDRSPREVLDSHLFLHKHGTLEDDLLLNYDPQIVILTSRGVYWGYDGMRSIGKLLGAQLPGGVFEYKTVLVEGEIGFMEWTAWSREAIVTDGVDTYVIRGGRIVAQTVHFTIQTF